MRKFYYDNVDQNVQYFFYVTVLSKVSLHKKRSHDNPQKIFSLLKSLGTEANIQEMYDIGHSLTMEAEYDEIPGLENQQGGTFGQKNARAITNFRDEHLADSFTQQGGLYFAGYSHIAPVKKILQDKQIAFNEANSKRGVWSAILKKTISKH